MTSGKGSSREERREDTPRELTLNKETLRDLDVGEREQVRGGMRQNECSCACGSTYCSRWC